MTEEYEYNDIVKMLRNRACPAGEPWTGDNPEEDHGHTDCWLLHQAADEIERLRSLIAAWADADDTLVALNGTRATYDILYEAERRSDAALDALRKAVGR